MRALRAAVYASGFGLIAWGLILSFFITWFWVAIILGLALIIAAGLAEYVARHGTEDAPVDLDCGFGDTLFGLPQSPPYLRPVSGPPPIETTVIHSPAPAFSVIEGGKGAVWPDEAGAPE